MLRKPGNDGLKYLYRLPIAADTISRCNSEVVATHRHRSANATLDKFPFILGH
jgi:hypothetical protein